MELKSFRYFTELEREREIDRYIYREGVCVSERERERERKKGRELERKTEKLRNDDSLYYVYSQCL